MQRLVLSGFRHSSASLAIVLRIECDADHVRGSIAAIFTLLESLMPLPACLDGNLRIPVIGAPMFIVSIPDLVIAQCKAGIVGSFPALNPANYTRHAYEPEPEQRKLPPNHFVWKENETWSGNMDSLFAPEPAPVEHDRGPQSAEVECT